MAAMPAPLVRRPARHTGMSYKFQRLRERIRDAIRTGELAGKLPGERALAKRFHVNAKTLSKALTDLAAEGVLDRSIGRGTFVKGSAPEAAAVGRWLVVCNTEEKAGPLVAALTAMNPDVEVISDIAGLRPSFLNQFGAVLSLSTDTPESFLRDLTVRNMPLVLLNREPATFSVHSVVVDISLAGTRLGRALVLEGHRHFVAVEPAGSSVLRHALHHAGARHGAEVVVESSDIAELASHVEHGATAVVCASPTLAVAARDALLANGHLVPATVSLAAFGCAPSTLPCSGYYVSPQEMAEAAANLLRDTGAGRPAVLWLAGEWHDANSTGPGDVMSIEHPPRPIPLGLAS